MSNSNVNNISSSQKVAELYASAESAKANFSTTNVIQGNCKKCNCKAYIRYYYDDGLPVPNAPFTITDSTGQTVSGSTDDQGLCLIESMPCGGFEIVFGEGSDELIPQELLENNPVFQTNPEYASIVGEYFTLYALMRRLGYIHYDVLDSYKNSVDLDDSGFLWGSFNFVPDKYQAAYDRLCELNDYINDHPGDLTQAVNKIFSNLPAELVDQSGSDIALQLFCEVGIGLIPYVGTAVDLIYLGKWLYKTYDGADGWVHYTEGALISIGFVPGLGDLIAQAGKAILKALKIGSKAAMKSAVKLLRSHGNGNIIKYLDDVIVPHLTEYFEKASRIINQLITALEKIYNNTASWIHDLVEDKFTSLLEPLKTLKSKLDGAKQKLKEKINEFIESIENSYPQTPLTEIDEVVPAQINTGVQHPMTEHPAVGKGELDSSGVHTKERAEVSDEIETKNSDPIDFLSGNMIEDRTDFIVSGLLPISLQRYYKSSKGFGEGVLGPVWRTNWDISIELEDGRARFIDYDYSTSLYVIPYSEEKPSYSVRKPQLSLHRVGHDLVLRHHSGLEYVFGCAIGSTLKLSEIRDNFGHSIQFKYDRTTLTHVLLDDGRYIDVVTKHGIIVALDLVSPERGILERLASYQYDKKGYLTQVRAAPGCNFDYQYDKNGYLTRWEDLAHTWVEHDFDEQGRAIATRCADGLWWDKVHYDDQNHITYHKTALGGVVQYHLDEQNHPIKIVEPDGGATLQEWDGEHITAIVNPLGERSEYTYDTLGNLTSVTLPSGIAHEYTYNEAGQLTAYTNPIGATWALNYSDAGTLSAVSDPDGRTWHYEYNKHGLRTLTKGPDGLAVRYEYDKLGQLIRLLPDMGEAVSFEYDPLGRLTSRTIGENHTRYWKYEKTARAPSSVHYEDGTHASFEYDIEGNLIKVTDASGQSSRFTYGAFDKLKSATDPQGAVTQYHYNPLAEFAGVTNSQGNEWRYEFDECGRIHTERHYDGRKELYRYDAAGRLNKHIKPDQHELAYFYNTDGQLTETHAFDPLGERTGRTWYDYDDAGRLIAAENGDIDVLMKYSPGGALVKEWLGGVPLEHQFDSAGYRTGLTGTQTPRQFDWQRGQLSGLQIGSHQALNFAYNPIGLEQSRQTEQGFNLHHDWDERGRLQAQRLGGNQPYAKSQTLRNYHYDSLDRLVGIDDSHWGSERFELNNNCQITKRIHEPQKGSHYQYVTLFGYDSELNLNETASGTLYTDNVVPISQAALNKEKRQYDNAGRVVKTGRFTYHYDECGRAIQKIEQKDGFRPLTTKFSWDEHDRLIRIELPTGERWRYRYDAFGRRVAKECERGAQATQQVHYLYDGAQLIQQTLKTANGADVETTEYIYEPGSFRPVAQVNTNHELQTEKLHYIVNDYSGTPRELCTETGDIVWRGEQGLWQRHQQRLQTNVKRLFEDAANDPVHCDLRYQGQLEDNESGLYYNLNRYYDADSGQYLSSDPIGMLGGLRPQAYVHNPMEWVDPLGLAGCGTSRKGAFRQAKKDAGIPLNQHPDMVYNERTGMNGQYNQVRMTDSNGQNILGSDGKPIWTRQYQYTRADGKKIIIQDHSAGHYYGDNGVGDQGSHFNVRPIENTRTGKVAGTLPHYEFKG